MRLDIPQDVPRRREIGPDNNSSPDNRKTPPAAPETPVQQRLDSLRERADHRQPYHPRPRMERGAASRERRIRTVDPEDTRRARRVPHEVIGLELRDEEKKLLFEVGRFRVRHAMKNLRRIRVPHSMILENLFGRTHLRRGGA